MLDLWGNDEEELYLEESEITKEITIPPGKDLALFLTDDKICIASTIDLTEDNLYSSLEVINKELTDNVYHYNISLSSVQAFALRWLLKKYKTYLNDEDKIKLKNLADRVPTPKALLSENRKTIEVHIPYIEAYRQILRTVNAYPIKDGGYRVAIARLLDLKSLSEMMDNGLPKIEFSTEVEALTSEPIPGFDGTIESLKNISVGELNVIKTNSQSYKQIKKNTKTLTEKMEVFGISTLYDLLNWLPRRYIDKSKPQDLRDLIVDESATIIGVVDSCSYLPNNKGVYFTISLDGGGVIKVNFWRQNWLKDKFKIGSKVLITGKFLLWNKTPQLNGTSIEFSEEASVLSIVPIYKQSDSKGITTALLLAAVREMFSRMPTLKLPPYLDKEGRMNYYEAYQELHLPTTLEHNKKVIDNLAYYELVNMQIIIQEAKEISEIKPGVSQKKSKLNLQEKAIQNLPFTLTKGQFNAIEELNKKLEDDKPSSTLLQADVGAGKTLIAQLSCLRAVEAGFQAVLFSPTDILGRQLYSTFEKIVNKLNENGENIKICYLSGSMKAAEKKKMLADIKSGDIDIIVGTHSVVSKGVEYANLGFICIDEQQKFGAEQRTYLLNARQDNRIPDMLMQTATPIPRSTAQVMYGDVDMIIIDEKPPGRLPIKTIWLEEDPNEIITQPINPLWTDLRNEVKKGNQIFIITPMVRDSISVDSASVERTFKSLTEIAFSDKDIRIGFVHGQMKQDEQKQVMEDFSNKKYDVIVASTVVEVGVDIPDATRVVVLSAERLGASSLHQIRGRVGRNSKPSVCYLVSLGKTDNSRIRLQSLVDFESGFDVANVDLSTRGEGTMFGSEQSGASEMVFASITKHAKWLPQAKQEALEILAGPYREQAIRESKEKFSAEDRLL